MSESPINPKIKIIEKRRKKFSGILRHLAKSDSSLVNKMNITVYKDDIIEEEKQIIIAPSMYLNCRKPLNNHKSAENTIVNIFENLVIEKGNPSPVQDEQIDYPDSSDFEDDDE